MTREREIIKSDTLVESLSDRFSDAGSIPAASTRKKHCESSAFFNDVCPIGQKMRASHMMSATPNDVCLRAHRGKHRITANKVSNIISTAGCDIIDCRKAIYIIDIFTFICYNDPDGFFSDIISALSRGDIETIVKHQRTYWTHSEKQAQEIFANMYSMGVFDQKEHFETLEKIFPDLVQTWGKIIGG